MMNTPHTNNLPSASEHIRAVPKPDRRRRSVDVTERRRAIDRVRIVAASTSAPFDRPTAAEPLRIPA